MPLVRCPACKAATPSAAIRCVHCGALAPLCAACKGTGSCSECELTASYGMAGNDCPTCGGTSKCPVCSGEKRRWIKPDAPKSP